MEFGLGPVKGLPLNCYSAPWLESLDEWQLEALVAKSEEYGFEHEPEVMRLVSKHDF